MELVLVSIRELCLRSDVSMQKGLRLNEALPPQVLIRFAVVHVALCILILLIDFNLVSRLLTILHRQRFFAKVQQKAMLLNRTLASQHVAAGQNRLKLDWIQAKTWSKAPGSHTSANMIKVDSQLLVIITARTCPT